MFCQGNRKPIQLTPEQVQQLMHYVNTGDVAGGWKYLAGLGDRYADDAAASLHKYTGLPEKLFRQPCSMMGVLKSQDIADGLNEG